MKRFKTYLGNFSEILCRKINTKYVKAGKGNYFFQYYVCCKYLKKNCFTSPLSYSVAANIS